MMVRREKGIFDGGEVDARKRWGDGVEGQMDGGVRVRGVGVFSEGPA